MQPAFFSFVLIAVHVTVLVDCKAELQDAVQLQHHQHSRFNTRTHADTSAGMEPFYLEMYGSVRKRIHRDFLVILPVRTDTSNLVSIFGLRRKRFLCMDSNGQLYKSRHKESQDCVFQRIWLDVRSHHVVGAAHHESPGPSDALQRLLGPLVKRQRRSEEVNPSDPLRSESHPSHPVKDHKDLDVGQPEQDQAGAVSKETISSCDDPLRVLQPNGPVSPVKTNIADQAQQD